MTPPKEEERKEYIIIDTTTGDLVHYQFETWEEADEWKEQQDIPEKYLIE
jgi:hypothetical protein